MAAAVAVVQPKPPESLDCFRLDVFPSNILVISSSRSATDEKGSAAALCSAMVAGITVLFWKRYDDDLSAWRFVWCGLQRPLSTSSSILVQCCRGTVVHCGTQTQGRKSSQSRIAYSSFG